MLRRDDPEGTVAKGTLTKTDPLWPVLAVKGKRHRIAIRGYEARLRLGAGRLRRPLILIVSTGFASRLPSVSA